MPGFLQISLTNRCNLACWHCPMKEYRNGVPPRWPLDNATLIPWIGRNCNPDGWVVELTGGEPALYDGIEELCTWLSEHGYRTIVKTNGMLPIASGRPNILRVAAFHQLKNPPVYFDEILIVDKIDSDEKISVCRERGWPFQVIGFGKENPDNATHGFSICAFVNNAGHQCGCAADVPMERIQGDGIDHGRIDHRPLVPRVCCPQCKAAIDCWRFIHKVGEHNGTN